MTSLRSVTCLTAILGVFLSHGPPPAQEAKVTMPSTQEAAKVLQRVLKLKADSYHVLLREAAILAPPVLKNQEWAEIQKLMKENPFAPIEAWENGDAVHSYHILQSKAFTFPNGHSLDLYLLLSAPNLDRPRQPARPGKPYRADVALVADFNAPYSQVIGEKRYPKGSIIDAILASVKVKQVGEVWPLLKRIYVHYGYIDSRWASHNPSGFHVSVEFTASTKEEIAGKKMYFNVASGLDPLQSLEGKETLLKNFRPQDTLDGIREGGGNEWWHGNSEAVEANKRKYLKTKE